MIGAYFRYELLGFECKRFDKEITLSSTDTLIERFLIKTNYDHNNKGFYTPCNEIIVYLNENYIKNNNLQDKIDFMRKEVKEKTLKHLFCFFKTNEIKFNYLDIDEIGYKIGDDGLYLAGIASMVAYESIEEERLSNEYEILLNAFDESQLYKELFKILTIRNKIFRYMALYENLLKICNDLCIENNKKNKNYQSIFIECMLYLKNLKSEEFNCIEFVIDEHLNKKEDIFTFIRNKIGHINKKISIDELRSIEDRVNNDFMQNLINTTIYLINIKDKERKNIAKILKKLKRNKRRK